MDERYKVPFYDFCYEKTSDCIVISNDIMTTHLHIWTTRRISELEEDLPLIKLSALLFY